MTAPLTGIQRVRLDALVVQLTERRMKTKAADLRHALALIDTQAAVIVAAGDLLIAIPPGRLWTPERDRVLAQIDALVTGLDR
jgi:hypothetical protein